MQGINYVSRQVGFNIATLEEADNVEGWKLLTNEGGDETAAAAQQVVVDDDDNNKKCHGCFCCCFLTQWGNMIKLVESPIYNDQLTQKQLVYMKKQQRAKYKVKNK